MTPRPGSSPPRSDLAWGALAAASLLLLNVAYVASSLGFVHKPRAVLETDHLRYLEMARAPAGTDAAVRQAPFCWRVLTPWLANLLGRAGLGLNPAFYLLTNLFLFGFLLTLFLHLRAVGHGAGMSLLGLTLAGLVQGAVRWYEYQYWMTDPLCLFLVMLAFLLIDRGRDAALAALSVAGVLARESYLLVLVYYVLRRWRTQGRGAGFWRALGTASLAVAVLALVRGLLEPTNDPDSMRTIARVSAFRLRHLLDNQAYLLSVGSIGVLFPMILLSPRRLVAWCRSRYDEAAYLALVYLSLVMGNNTERLLAYGLPVVVPLALLQLERFAEEARAPRVWLGAVCLGLQALFWTQTRLLGEQGLSAYQPANAAVAVAMASFWLACRLRLGLVARRASGRA